jgi:hypothetical protein
MAEPDSFFDQLGRHKQGYSKRGRRKAVYGDPPVCHEFKRFKKKHIIPIQPFTDY